MDFNKRGSIILMFYSFKITCLCAVRSCHELSIKSLISQLFTQVVYFDLHKKQDSGFYISNRSNLFTLVNLFLCKLLVNCIEMNRF